MSSIDPHSLPPLPSGIVPSAKACAVVRLYLAVEDDVSMAHMQTVTAHVQRCPDCAHEQQTLRRASLLVAGLEAVSPSDRVDQAVMAAIATAGQRQDTHHAAHRSSVTLGSWRFKRLISLGMVAALFVLVVVTSLAWLISGGPHGQQPTTFELPANLSWNTYVLYRTQTMAGSQSESYQVTSYQDMADHQSHIQVVMPGKLDVVIIENKLQSLGLDMMHHTAQWDVQDWKSNEPWLFDLDRLRYDLRTGRAIYQGKTSFQDQQVYRIRYPNKYILLLDMHYMPVNVLTEHNDPGSAKPMYQTLRWLHPSQVSPSLWNMSIPDGFTMGNLPPKP